MWVVLTTYYAQSYCTSVLSQMLVTVSIIARNAMKTIRSYAELVKLAIN